MDECMHACMHACMHTQINYWDALTAPFVRINLKQAKSLCLGKRQRKLSVIYTILNLQITSPPKFFARKGKNNIRDSKRRDSEFLGKWFMQTSPFKY